MDKARVASLSVASNAVLTVSKVLIGVFSGSVSIISEGIHSGIDLVASVIALIAVRESGKPADVRHAYGHGKIENISGTIEAVLIFIAALLIIIEAIQKIVEGVRVVNYSLGLIVMGLSAVSNFIISSLLLKVARKTDSIALEADALHLRTDIYTSLGVFLGLFLIKVTGWAILDPIVAIGVSVLIIKTAFDLTKESFMHLVDVSLPLEEQEAITEIINRHSEGFVEFHELRTRKSGSERHIDLHLVVPKYASVAEVHELCDQIENEVMEELPGTSILIHAEPCGQLMDSCSVCEQSKGVCQYCAKKNCTKKNCRERAIEQESI